MHEANPKPETLKSSTKEQLDRYVAPTYSRFPYGFTRGKGLEIWDECGNSYLDFGAGIAVTSLGHAHPAITGAIHAQVESLIHCSNLYYTREQAALAEHLVERVVGEAGKVFFCNSGAEANEALFKLARRFGNQVPHAGGETRHEIITFEGSFHGRTFGGISATGQSKVQQGFGPLLPGFRTVHFNDLEAVRAAITKQTAAVLLEPVQGEGGIHVAQPDFLRGVVQLCREHSLLFMLDEVQCGLGRVGAMCAWRAIVEDAQVRPDAIAWAKGMGGGVPIGGAWIRHRPISESEDTALCDLLGPGSHGSTFGGQPLASCASLAALEEIDRHELWKNASEMGQFLVQSIESWNHPLVSQVRGLGLMLGIVIQDAQLQRNPALQKSDSTAAAFVVNRLMQAGLITIPAGRDVIRLLPALNLERIQAQEALEIIRTTFDSLIQESSES